MEMLYIAQYLGIPIREVSVNWQEIEGTLVYLQMISIALLCSILLENYKHGVAAGEIFLV